MGNIEDDFLADAEDDRLTVEFIKNYLPQDVKEKFTEDDLYYFLDVIGEYYVKNTSIAAILVSLNGRN